MTLNAQALYYAILISVIISLSCGLLVLLSQLQHRQLEADLQFQRQLRNLESGITLLLAGYLTSPAHQTIDLFGHGEDPVNVSVRDWGLFEAGSVSVLQPDGTPADGLHRNLLLGTRHNPTLHTAVYLPDLQRPLVLAGHTTIRGTASLPKAGAIRGKGNTASPLINGAMQTSGPLLPIHHRTQLEMIVLHQIPGGPEYAPGVPLVRSFSKPAWQLDIPGGYLTHEKITGHVVISDPEKLTVGPDCEMEDVILHAPVIAFEDGFKGSVQALATRQIFAGQNCRFDYPSVLAVFPQSSADEIQPLIQMNAGSHISGCIRMQGAATDSAPPLLILEENTAVTGQVWVEGAVDLRGQVTGNVTCNLFVRQEPEGRYENQLKDATIDRTTLPDAFVPPLADAPANAGRDLVKWLK